MIAVSDSTPLMHFAKVRKLALLRLLYKKIAITETVHIEVVEDGVLLGKKDALEVKRELGKWIEIKEPKIGAEKIAEKYRIHLGEAASIALAKEMKALLLINEREGRNAAVNEGVKVKGTIGVIAEGIKKKALTKKEAVEILNTFKEKPEEFWIEPKIINKAIKKLQ